MSTRPASLKQLNEFINYLIDKKVISESKRSMMYQSVYAFKQEYKELRDDYNNKVDNFEQELKKALESMK